VPSRTLTSIKNAGSLEAYGNSYENVWGKLAELNGQTVVVTNANGQSAGYIPDDAAYAQYTFQVLSTRIKPGCAETAIVDAVLDMMDQSLSH